MTNCTDAYNVNSLRYGGLFYAHIPASAIARLVARGWVSARDKRGFYDITPSGRSMIDKARTQGTDGPLVNSIQSLGPEEPIVSMIVFKETIYVATRARVFRLRDGTDRLEPLVFGA